MEERNSVPVGSPTGQNEVASTRPLIEPIGEITGYQDGPEKGQFRWSMKRQGKSCKGVLGRKPANKGGKSRE
jgi:hypothetical protein